MDIDKILVSNKPSSINKKCKYSIGHRHGNYKIKSLSIMLPQASAHVKSYDD